MKRDVCPNCGKKWNDNEIEFQVCDDCGFEDDNEYYKSIAKKIGIWVIAGAIIIIISALAGAIYQEILPDRDGKAFSLLFALGGIYAVQRFLKKRKNKI